MKPACERCGAPLLPETPAFTCAHSCTFCHACTDSLGFRCPNCGGMLLDRRRASIVVATATEALACIARCRTCASSKPASAWPSTPDPSERSSSAAGWRAACVAIAQRQHSRTARGAASGRDDAAVRRRVDGTARVRRAALWVLSRCSIRSSRRRQSSTRREREAWASVGFAGVDMETGLIDAPRIAAVRVVLDTPQRELSAEWVEPLRALRSPRNWPQLFWFARNAPRFARRAAQVVAAARV